MIVDVTSLSDTSEVSQLLSEVEDTPYDPLSQDDELKAAISEIFREYEE